MGSRGFRGPSRGSPLRRVIKFEEDSSLALSPDCGGEGVFFGGVGSDVGGTARELAGYTGYTCRSGQVRMRDSMDAMWVISLPEHIAANLPGPGATDLPQDLRASLKPLSFART